jgi:HEAT repeat protein
MEGTDLDSLVADLTGGDESRAEAAVRGLAALGRSVLPALEALLASPEPDRRWWAVRALAEIDDPGAPALLKAALNDIDPSVRECAALALRHRPHAGAIPDLVRALSDSDRLLAHLAADALAAAGSPAVEPLIRVLEDGPAIARTEAARALAKIADPRSIPTLFKTFDQDSALVEYWANEALEKMGVGMAFFKP